MTTDPLERREVADSGAAASAEGVFGLPFLTPGRLKRLVKFGLVGVSGVVVNVAVFEVFFRLVHLQFALANAVGIAVSIFTNYLLNDSWTWGDRIKGDRRRDWFHRLGKYYVSAAAAAGVQLVVASATKSLVFGDWPVEVPSGLPLESTSVDMGPTLAVLAGIVAGMAINFLASHLWAFRDVEVEA